MEEIRPIGDPDPRGSAWDRVSGWIGQWASLRTDLPRHCCDPRDEAYEAPLCVVTTAFGQPEAEMLRRRLCDAGIAAVARRARVAGATGESRCRYLYVAPEELDRAHTVLATPA